MNILYGEPNTSKSKTLDIIDFLLGKMGTVASELGRAMEDEYESFELVLRIGESRHSIQRFTVPSGRTRAPSALIDGEKTNWSNFNDWIMGRLGWPQMRIPKGNVYRATDDIALTFRTMLRHIYRNSNSWGEFANKEESFATNAVVAFFLDLAERIYDTRGVETNRIRMRQEALLEQRRDLERRINDHRKTVLSLLAISTQPLLVPDLTSATQAIDEEILDLELSLRQLEAEVDAVQHTYPSQDTEVAEQAQITAAMAAAIAELEVMYEEQEQIVSSLDAELQKAQRGATSAKLFGSFFVTSCPSCMQSLKFDRETAAAAGVCYVCHQEVSQSALQRRLEIEVQAIASEASEYEEYLASLRSRINDLRVQWQESRDAGLRLAESSLAVYRERMEPILKLRESVAISLGQKRQERESVANLGLMDAWLTEIDASVAAMDAEMLEVYSNPRAPFFEDQRSRRIVNHLSSEMNRFIDAIGASELIKAPISVRGDRGEFEFLVGETMWNQGLGSEGMVAFLLAYHYAWLQFAAQGIGWHPGLAMIDNPFQHDVDVMFVERAIQQYAKLCGAYDGLQVIIATRRRLPEVPARHIAFDRVYVP